MIIDWVTEPYEITAFVLLIYSVLLIWFNKTVEALVRRFFK